METVAHEAADIRLKGATAHGMGAWVSLHLDRLEQALSRVQWPQDAKIDFDLKEINAMDTAGAWILHRTIRRLERDGKTVGVSGLPEQWQELLALVARAGESCERVGAAPEPVLLEKIGRTSITHAQEYLAFLHFIGETAVVALRLLSRPGRIRWKALLHHLEAAGCNALPIVGLLSFLVGVVIAYQGGVQLERYGASIYVADMVGISMLRELSPLITAIIVAGRTGSAYTAQIGTMRVTEEVDALKTMAIAPLELLVLPRLLALVIVLPLLTVYADVIGVIGGMVMSKNLLGIGVASFIDRLEDVLIVDTFLIGVGKAPVFAAIIATVGCFQGFRVSASAESVGRQTTVSVVQAIFLVIVADAVFSIIFSWLGI